MSNLYRSDIPKETEYTLIIPLQRLYLEPYN